MTEDKNYPFIKNSYFPGKLLHAGDFTDEQNYHCRKSQFLNQGFSGSGIVSGLTVTPYTEGRLILSKGFGLDGAGRPVVVKETARVNVEGLEDFVKSQNGEFVLGISYDEKEVQTEYCSLDETDHKYHASRIEETWKLKAYTMEEFQKQEKVRKPGDGEFFDRSVLYQDHHVKITQQVPLTAAAGGLFLVRLTASCLSDRPVRLSFGCMLTLRGGIFQETGEPFYRVREDITVAEDTVLEEIRVLAGRDTKYPLYLDTTRFYISIDGRCIQKTVDGLEEEGTPEGVRSALSGGRSSLEGEADRPEGVRSALGVGRSNLEGEAGRPESSRGVLPGGRSNSEGEAGRPESVRGTLTGGRSSLAGKIDVPGVDAGLDQACAVGNRYVSVFLADDYEEAIRSRLREHCFMDQEFETGDWLPLARVLYSTGGGKTKIERIDGDSVRYYAASPVLEEGVRRISRESGITGGGFAPGPYPQPYPPCPSPGPHPYPPCPGAGSAPQPYPSQPGPAPVIQPDPEPHLAPQPEAYPYPPGPGPFPPGPPSPCLTIEQVKELIDRDWESHIRRGVTVIPIPKHCKNGKILYSEVISHGFPGEEVIIRYGRVWKDTNYAFWERDKKRYTFFYEREDLFPPMENSGWQAADYGLKQNLEEGTFQIAVKLTKHFGKVHEKEIAVSWTAIRTT